MRMGSWDTALGRVPSRSATPRSAHHEQRHDQRRGRRCGRRHSRRRIRLRARQPGHCADCRRTLWHRNCRPVNAGTIPTSSRRSTRDGYAGSKIVGVGTTATTVYGNATAVAGVAVGFSISRLASTPRLRSATPARSTSGLAANPGANATAANAVAVPASAPGSPSSRSRAAPSPLPTRRQPAAAERRRSRSRIRARRSPRSTTAVRSTFRRSRTRPLRSRPRLLRASARESCRSPPAATVRRRLTIAARSRSMLGQRQGGTAAFAIASEPMALSKSRRGILSALRSAATRPPTRLRRSEACSPSTYFYPTGAIAGNASASLTNSGSITVNEAANAVATGGMRQRWPC